jgi:hypothetical protein
VRLARIWRDGLGAERPPASEVVGPVDGEEQRARPFTPPGQPSLKVWGGDGGEGHEAFLAAYVSNST